MEEHNQHCSMFYVRLVQALKEPIEVEGEAPNHNATTNDAD
jgi:hypothetical protein